MRKKISVRKEGDVSRRALAIDEIELVCDLRLLWSKLDDVFEAVEELRGRYERQDIVTYAETPTLEAEISRIDQLYLWFAGIKEELDRRRQ